MIVAVAGRRIDAVDASVARFPLARVEAVRAGIRARLVEVGATAIVSSGACGTDLIALEVAAELGLRRRVILPFGRALFRETSVTDRPGEWGGRYDAICDALAKTGDLEELGYLPEGERTYAETNLRIVERAVEYGGSEATTNGAALPNAIALLVWEGTSRGPDDMTAHFGEVAVEHGLAVEYVLTLSR
jgi:hypothetical protein